MTYASPEQIDALRIAAEAHGLTIGDAVFNYFGAPQSLSTIPANLIDDMIARAGEKPVEAAIDMVAHTAEVEAASAAEAARRDANYVSPEDFYAAQEAKEAAEARIDAIIEERGLSHLTGKDRREARRLIRRELEA